MFAEFLKIVLFVASQDECQKSPKSAKIQQVTITISTFAFNYIVVGMFIHVTAYYTLDIEYIYIRL